MNPRFRDLAVPIGAASRAADRRIERRELTELLDILAAAGVHVRVDRLGVLVVEGLTRDAAPHIACAVEVLEGREPAVKRLLEKRDLFVPEAVARRAKVHVEARAAAGMLKTRPTHRRLRSPDGSWAPRAAEPEP